MCVCDVCVNADKPSGGYRFVSIPVASLGAKLEKQIKDLETDVDGLGKKLHYLEMTAKNSQEHISQMLGRRGEASGA